MARKRKGDLVDLMSVREEGSCGLSISECSRAVRGEASRAQRRERESRRTSVEIEAGLAAVLAGGENLLIVDTALSLEGRVDDACGSAR